MKAKEGIDYDITGVIIVNCQLEGDKNESTAMFMVFTEVLTDDDRWHR